MRYLALITMLLTLSTASFAFRVDARININNQVATAVVFNQWARPIVCSGRLFAMDAGSRWINQWMNNVMIFPGQHAYLTARVHGYGNYFREAHAEINCNFR